MRLILLLWIGIIAASENTLADDAVPSHEISVLKRTPVPSLSPDALDALVSGIAFYPDALIESILDAAQDPTAIHKAAQGQTGEFRPSHVLLKNYPELLTKLDRHLVLTSRLGLAAKYQPLDVPASIVRVRMQVNGADVSEGDTVAATPVKATAKAAVRPYQAFVRELLIADVVEELRPAHMNSHAAGIGGNHSAAPPGDKPTATVDTQVPNARAAEYVQHSETQLKAGNDAISQAWEQLEQELSANRVQPSNATQDGYTRTGPSSEMRSAPTTPSRSGFSRRRR